MCIISCYTACYGYLCIDVGLNAIIFIFVGIIDLHQVSFPLIRVHHEGAKAHSPGRSGTLGNPVHRVICSPCKGKTYIMTNRGQHPHVSYWRMSPVPLFTICKSILTQVLFNSLDNCSAKCHRCNVIKAGSINSHRKKFCNYGLISSSSLATRHNPNKFGFCSRCSFGRRFAIFLFLSGAYCQFF